MKTRHVRLAGGLGAMAALLVAAMVLGFGWGVVGWLLGSVATSYAIGVTSHATEVVHGWLYRLAVGALLAATAVCTAGALRFYFVEGGHGFVILGATAIAASMLGWRALVRPTARRAAQAGTAAVIGPTVAIIADLVRLDGDLFWDEHWSAIAFIAVYVAMILGLLVSATSVLVFRAALDELPPARIRD